MQRKTYHTYTKKKHVQHELYTTNATDAYIFELTKTKLGGGGGGGMERIPKTSKWVKQRSIRSIVGTTQI